MTPPSELQENLAECLTSHLINSIGGSPVHICNLMGEGGAIPMVPNYSNQPPPWDMVGNPEVNPGLDGIATAIGRHRKKALTQGFEGLLG